MNNIDSSDKEDIINLLNDYGIRKNVSTPLRAHVLSLLLYLEEDNGLENFFKNININNYELDTLYIKVSQNPLLYNVFYTSINRKDIPKTLYNIYKLFYGLYEENIYSSKYNIVYNFSLYKIFKIIFKNNLDFNIIPDNILYFDSYNFANYLNKCDNDKPLILPNTIKKLELRTNIEKYNFPYIKLPVVVEQLKINTEENINPLNIIMPLKINECDIPQIPFRVSNLIFRKEILYMDNEELKEYLKKIYSKIIINIKETQNYNYYTGYNKINNLNVYLNKLCIEKDNEIFDKISVNFDKLSNININNIETSDFINKVITCIIDSINNYKNGIYKKYIEPKEILDGLYLNEVYIIYQKMREEEVNKKTDLLLPEPNSNIDLIKIALANNYNNLLKKYYLHDINNQNTK